MENVSKIPIIIDIPPEILQELPKRHILGGGKNSIVYLNGSGEDGVIKKYYKNRNRIIKSARIQERVQKILCDYSVRVPDIYYIDNKKSIICMEQIKTHSNFHTNLIHTIFGYPQEYLDTLWSIPGTYIIKGFYASSETIHSLAEQNRWIYITDKNIVFIMGSILRCLIDENIIPYGIEWVIDETGRIWLIDFDECEEGSIDPNEFFYSTYLDCNIYTPKYGSTLYPSFYHGYFGHPIKLVTNINESYFNNRRTETEFNVQIDDDQLDMQIESCVESISLMDDENIIIKYIDGFERN